MRKIFLTAVLLFATSAGAEPPAVPKSGPVPGSGANVQASIPWTPGADGLMDIGPGEDLGQLDGEILKFSPGQGLRIRRLEAPWHEIKEAPHSSGVVGVRFVESPPFFPKELEKHGAVYLIEVPRFGYPGVGKSVSVRILEVDAIQSRTLATFQILVAAPLPQTPAPPSPPDFSMFVPVGARDCYKVGGDAVHGKLGTRDVFLYFDWRNGDNLHLGVFATTYDANGKAEDPPKMLSDDLMAQVAEALEAYLAAHPKLEPDLAEKYRSRVSDIRRSLMLD